MAISYEPGAFRACSGNGLKKRVYFIVQNGTDGQDTARVDKRGRLITYRSLQAAKKHADALNAGPQEKPAFPKRVAKIVARCLGGETLCRATAPMGGETRYWFEPSQKEAGPRSCEEAISRGLLIPSGDGLFAGMDQTFRAAPGVQV